METEKSILLQKTIENERLKNNIEGLNNEILEKEQAINLKKNSLFDLLDQDEKLKDSVKKKKI